MTMNTIEGLTIRWQPWTLAATLGHLWLSTLVGLGILALMFAARRASARTRWMVGCIGLAKFILPLIWFNPTISRLRPASLDGLPAFPGAVHLGGIAHAADPAAASRTLWVQAASAAWAADAILLIGGWFLRGYRFRRRLLATAQPVSTALAAAVARASRRVGLPEAPRCLSVAGDSGPGIVGVFSPFVVLPRSLESSLTSAEIDAILTHECVHLKRHDALMAGIQAVVVRLFWFDPVVWLLDRSLRTEMEKSCDEAVLDITADAETYAGGIVKVVRRSLGLREPGFAGAAGVSTVARVRNILARSAAPHVRRPMLAAIGAAAALAAFSGFSGAIRADAAAPLPSGKALVVANSSSRGRIPDFEAELGDLGFASATIDSADMATTDFSKYNLIVIPGTQLQTGLYANYAKAAARFERFVRNGGTLLLEVKGSEGEGILRQRYGAIPSPFEAGETRAP